jgi:hypothetical protein
MTLGTRLVIVIRPSVNIKPVRAMLCVYVLTVCCLQFVCHILKASVVGVTHSVDCVHTGLCGVCVMHLHV